MSQLRSEKRFLLSIYIFSVLARAAVLHEPEGPWTPAPTPSGFGHTTNSVLVYDAVNIFIIRCMVIAIISGCSAYLWDVRVNRELSSATGGLGELDIGNQNPMP